MATWLKMQKPIARSGSAWWPHGRVAQNTLSASPASIDAGAGGAHAAHHRVQRARRHHRVAAVERHQPLLRRQRGHGVDIVRVVHQQYLLAGAARRLAPCQRIEFRLPQRAHHRMQALGRLGVARAGTVLQAVGVEHHQRAHRASVSAIRDRMGGTVKPAVAVPAPRDGKAAACQITRSSRSAAICSPL
jgi:hypothetical protein